MTNRVWRNATRDLPHTTPQQDAIFRTRPSIATMVRGWLAAFLLACRVPAAEAFTITHSVHTRPVQRPPSIKMADTQAVLREVIMPPEKTNDKTLRNVIGVPLFVGGVATALVPSYAAELFNLNLGVKATSAVAISLLRGLAVTNVLLGTRVLRDDDKNAAATGLVLLGGWAVLLRRALAAGTVGGTIARTALWVHSVAALDCLRRIWSSSKLRTPDVVVSSLLPRDGSRDARLVGGSLLLGCGAAAILGQASILFGTAGLLGCAISAPLSLLASSLGLSAIVLAGRTYGAGADHAGVTALLATSAYVTLLPASHGGELWALPLVALCSLAETRNGGGAKAKPKAKPAAKKAKAKAAPPAAATAEAKPKPAAKGPPPPGYQWDSFGRLIAMPIKDSFAGA